MSIQVGFQETPIDPFKVYIRIRPLLEKEKNQIEKNQPAINKSNQKQTIKNILLAEDNLLFVLDPDTCDFNQRKEKNFVFDNVFTEHNSNYIIFDTVIRNMVDNVLNGYNSTALAYGVTGTGKTHTMFGNVNEAIEEEYKEELSHYREKGVCVYALDYLFSEIENNVNKNSQVKISYLEIYNETVIDLLVTNPSPLMIVEDSQRGVVVPDLSEYEVGNSKDLLRYIVEGNMRRTMAATNQNQFSSRSHAILQVVVEQKNRTRDTKEELIISKFLIVDLAGSERGGLEKGLRSQEGANINKSLLSLGNCINILSDKSKKGSFVPYRDSKLTRLLKDSLGGNISTVMIACVSPAPMSYDETINTLKYASRARTIEKKICKNVKEVDVHISQYKEIIDSLKNEIDQLKEIIKNQQDLINDKITINQEKIINNSQSTPRLKIHQEEFSNINTVNDRNENNVNNLSNVNKSQINKSHIHPNKSVTKIKTYSEISKESVNHFEYFNKSQLRSVHNVNVEVYKKCLDNASTLNVENIIQFDNENNPMDDSNNISYNVPQNINLEKQIDNLQTDKLILEEYLEKSKIYDKNANEKYKIIKTFYQKYLELINEKLIENIEQNMILKFNMKEILDLNTTNNQHLNYLFSEMTHLEKIKLENYENATEDSNIIKIKEEIKNIQDAINENEKIKERISESLTRNLKLKKILKKVLVKLISNTSHKDKLNNTKNDQVFQNLIKEKEDLLNKNQKFEKNLKDLIKEKESKDSKLTQVQKEMEILKRQLKQKDERLKEIERNKSQNVSKIIPDEEDNTFRTEVEHVDTNFKKDYFNNKKKFINDINKNSDEKKVQSIKYIINQTNNIVNNNISKLTNKEKRNRPPQINKSTNNILNYDDKKLSKNNINKSRISASGILNNRARKLTSINFTPKNHNNNYNNSEIKIRSQSKSPRNLNNQKMRDFDKIIETQLKLNGVYDKKAKELGEKMKKKMNMNKSTHYQNTQSSRRETKSEMIDNFNNILDKFNKIDFVPNEELNKSLSISCVSMNNEEDFHSELDIAINIPLNSKKSFVTPKTEMSKMNKFINSKSIHNNISNNISNNVSTTPTQFNKMASNAEFSNKNYNIQKFLNNKENVSHPQSNSNINLQTFFTKEKPVQPNKRDYSPGLKQLHQARLEKQLKVVDNLTDSSASNIADSQSHISKNNIFVNKFISKNTVDFLNEYSNSKKLFKIDTENMNEQILIDTSRTHLPKSEALEAAMSSLIDYDMIQNIPDTPQNKILGTFTNEENNPKYDYKSDIEDNITPKESPLLILNSAEELFKTLSDIKNPKISKFLDKNKK